MYVNDGVCDYELCCDGSEEYSGVGGVKCENRCAEIGKEWRRVEEIRKAGMERAAKKRRTLSKESRHLRKNIEARISGLRLEIKDLEFKKNALESKYKDAEREERGKVVQGEGPGKLGVLLNLAKNRVSELRDALDKLLDQRDDLKDKVAELEDILRKFKEEYNPNFNDEGVKQAVKAWEDYAAKLETETKPDDGAETDLLEIMKEDSEESGVNWKEFEEDDSTDTDICKCCISPSSCIRS
jgi:protein kinase C substrate 80K-H